ncbi:PP2C family protein-serine/threonine phosphatase [Ketobacter sp.]|uniref:PP2C family protein-serine/threonine phosphatase n=1 Tax=Ketobacter sp. TaxID=2083498 RepID=UPI0025BE9D66|nr:protein phosphatase 2C domain-containing protein [Ketobacter sp.]
MALRFLSAACTHVGNVRKLNEDAYCEHAAAGVWCVADGMGGYDAGEVAANMVADAVSESLQRVQLEPDLNGRVAVVKQAIQSVNTRLTVERTQSPDSGMMGCTVVALIAEGQECACVWAGDSRFYLLRDAGLYQLSTDHSVVQELLDTGMIQPEEVDSHPRRHVITRAVGANAVLELDYIALDLLPGDVLLLCSDGLHSELSPERIMSILSAPQDCHTKATRLVESVLSGNANDNVTVTVIAVESVAKGMLLRE